MSLHLDAAPGAIAPTVLLPGDPLRARHIAERYFEAPVCHNERRAAYGFSGRYQGRPVSVQASGMGMPSMAIYARELVVDHGAQRLIRIGTCGALQPGMRVGDLVLAQGACSDSAMNRQALQGMDFAPLADYRLLRAADDAAAALGLRARVGNVVTSDHFYAEPSHWRLFAGLGVLVAEMETAALYTVAARHGAAALAILTVSDLIFDEGEPMAPEARERALAAATELALALV